MSQMSELIETPMIHTMQGNQPIADLEYSTSWEVADEYTKFIETYKLNGEIVRQSAHVLAKQGLFGESLTQTL